MRRRRTQAAGGSDEGGKVDVDASDDNEEMAGNENELSVLSTCAWR
ncbi:hypothetical protein PC116_g2370 [Phytophthora cactorum]|nr:hypothetical protein PC128_g7920 [Phytophthora cactorum]KAG4249956.1 hypothetical protein PC116_g2370 [Phytophthora cactorum]